MAIKSNKTEEQPEPKASEPDAVYGRTTVVHEDFPIGGKRERLSVDEYFDELWSLYLTKLENPQKNY